MDHQGSPRERASPCRCETRLSDMQSVKGCKPSMWLCLFLGDLPKWWVCFWTPFETNQASRGSLNNNTLKGALFPLNANRRRVTMKRNSTPGLSSRVCALSNRFGRQKVSHGQKEGTAFRFKITAAFQVLSLMCKTGGYSGTATRCSIHRRVCSNRSSGRVLSDMPPD